MHRSPERTVIGHRGNRRPMRKRNKTALVTAIALVLSGAAYSAHATFARDQSHKRVASDVNVAPSVRAAHHWQYGWTYRPTGSPSAPRTTSPATTSHPRPKTTTHPSRTAHTTHTPSTSSTTSRPPSSSSPPPSVRPGSGSWPGQVPGKFYLGMSCNTVCPQKERALSASYGVHRQFKGWGNWQGVAKAIQQDHQAGRLPWVSFKPPGGASGWQSIANGQHDGELKALAAVLKANDSQPVLLTFHHEPSNDGPDSQGKWWAAAYCHIHDLLQAQGALQNVADPPILGDWLFNPRNAQDPSAWLTPGVLQRMPFLGVDMYENTSGETFADRIPSILDWMAKQGYPDKMVGIGETGATDKYKASTGLSAAQWLNQSLSWAAANTDKIAVVSYFNSVANSRAGVYWPLDESPAKMAAYRSWLVNAKTVS
jgi:hypothetical protein